MLTGLLCAVVAIAGIGGIGAYYYYAKKAFDADPWGGVTQEQRGALARELSADEEMLACALLRRLPLGVGTSAGVQELTGVACLTHRRLVVGEANPYVKMTYAKMTIVELRHITGYVTHGEAGTIELRTADGRTYGLSGEHASTWRRFREQFRALADRQSSAAGLAGAGTELEKLAELVHRGILESADFDRAKGLLLGKPASQVQEDFKLLESLQALRRQGVLSESEFNMKKWDILSRTGGKA